MLEHRYRMELMLGRRLQTFEQVHHKNGAKLANNDGNLELWVRAQPGGQRVIDLGDFIVTHYPDLVSDRLRRIEL